MTRRRAALAALAAGWFAGCATDRPTGPAAALQVAPGVYVLRGAAGPVGPANLGRVGNAGFIVGETGVVAIDSGTSHAHGLALLQAIGRVTDRPVRLVLVTTPRQEFLFGGMAFRERGIPIRMQREAAQLMAARCATCLKTLQSVLGETAMRGTAMYMPDQTFETSSPLEGAGRALRVLHFGHSSGVGHVAVLDEATGTLFAGGLLDQQHIPDVIDSDFGGWRRALQALAALPIRVIVPGHGPASSPQLIATVTRYLDQLEARARALVEQGVSLREAPDATVLPEFTGWDQYDTLHRRNASIAYLRAERELLLK